MGKIGLLQVPCGKIITGQIMGPFKASTLYIKAKNAIKNYERSHGITPFKQLKKKTYKAIDDKTIDLKQQVNPFIAILKKSSANTTDVYYDKNFNPVISCSYQVTQKAFNKSTKMICNCISPEAKTHKSYYYLCLEQKYNVRTNYTDEFLTELIVQNSANSSGSQTSDSQ